MTARGPSTSQRVAQRFLRSSEDSYWDDAVRALNKFNAFYVQIERKPHDNALLAKCLKEINRDPSVLVWHRASVPDAGSTAELVAAGREVNKLTKDKTATNEAMRAGVEHFKDAAQRAIEGAAPEQFNYEGFKVINKSRFNRDAVRQVLDSIDYLKSLFKKRGVESLIHEGIARLVLVPDAKGAAAYFDSGLRELVMSVPELVKARPARFMTTIGYSGETLLHEFGHYVHRNYITGEAAEAWNEPWQGVPSLADPYANQLSPEKRKEKLDPLEIVTDYGKTDKYEDFAETFVMFMAAPDKLTPTAKYRMQRALSLSGLYGRPVMRLASHDIVARYLAAQVTPILQDEGSFVVQYLPQHQAVVPAITVKMHEALQKYRSAGLAPKRKLLVQVNGKGISHAAAAYWFDTNPPTMAIAPKSFKDPKLTHTLIHELGHYTHDQLPGSQRNVEIRQKYRWAMGQKATGEGPKSDVTQREIKRVEQEIKDLEADKYVTRPLPRKGEAFEFPYYENTVKYMLTGRIVKKSGDQLWVEVLSAPPGVRQLDVYRKVNGHPLLDRTVLDVTYLGVKPGVDEKIRELNQQKADFYTQMRSLWSEGTDDKYESQRHEWAPTRYSRESALEWFAELCTTYVLGHLSKDVEDWLLAVIKTGDAPK